MTGMLHRLPSSTYFSVVCAVSLLYGFAFSATQDSCTLSQLGEPESSIIIKQEPVAVEQQRADLLMQYEKVQNDIKILTESESHLHDEDLHHEDFHRTAESKENILQSHRYGHIARAAEGLLVLWSMLLISGCLYSKFSWVIEMVKMIWSCTMFIIEVIMKAIPWVINDYTISKCPIILIVVGSVGCMCIQKLLRLVSFIATSPAYIPMYIASKITSATLSVPRFLLSGVFHLCSQKI